MSCHKSTAIAMYQPDHAGMNATGMVLLLEQSCLLRVVSSRSFLLSHCTWQGAAQPL